MIIYFLIDIFYNYNYFKQTRNFFTDVWLDRIFYYQFSIEEDAK